MADYMDNMAISITDAEGNPRHRVYMMAYDGRYRIFLGDGIKREFTEESLPDLIKTYLGLINAHTWRDPDRKWRDKNGDPIAFTSITFTFPTGAPEVMFNIGWREGPHYCLVLHREEFYWLRGGKPERMWVEF